MIIRLTQEAADALKRVYQHNPDLSKQEAALVEELLYALSAGVNVNLTVSSGDLIIQKQNWSK